MVDTGGGEDVITGIGGVKGLGAAGGTGGTSGDAGLGGTGGTGGLGGRNDDFTLFNRSRAASGTDGITGTDGAAGADGTDGNAGADGLRGVGIYNDGVVRTGLGNDTVNAWEGGFDGTGKYYLGLGNDTVKGFGNGTFYGELGRDTLILPGQSSDYVISNLGGLNNRSFSIGATTLNAYSFESIQYQAV